MAHLHDDTAATEGALVSRVAIGDGHAFDVLVVRHRPAVALLARLVAPEGRREALVATTFDLAHTTLRRMQGPTESVRPFVLMVARRLHEEHGQGWAPHGHLLLGKPFREPGAGEMHPAVCVEFSRLPEAWQLLVWQLEVERDTAEGAAALVGVAPAVVPALVASARAALRRALLARHRSRTLPPVCLAHALRLGRTGGVLPSRAVLRHTAECDRCAMLLGDLDAVQRDLGEVVARHLLGRAAEDYLAVRRRGAAARLVSR